MVWKCCIPQCKSTSQIPVHRFPEDASKREHWLIAIGKTDLIGAPKEITTLTKLRICTKHFPENIVQPYGSRRRLTNNAVPTLHLLLNFEHVDINVNDNICEHVSVVENVPNNSAFVPLPINIGEETARKNEEEEIYVLRRNLRTQWKMLHNKNRIIYHQHQRINKLRRGNKWDDITKDMSNVQKTFFQMLTINLKCSPQVCFISLLC
ncbi:uncharacterized protein LOC112588863 [Harpegnathos saltator]|uniref:uncharacterized protein LOC112588863 n=1 Tax=Harpegnathos saltator TaxID=610380 RepID=UPI000DBEE84D|nr:uncharacterized protein LOC112588863 [Harpegnathos saltator]